jgi:pSer/pThr/pTyr-binding forkhead associated (FHA) protein
LQAAQFSASIRGVRSYTPVATPLVRGRPQRKERPAVGKRPEVVAPVTLLSPVGRFELGTGSLLLGRLPECDVTLTDALASRMHARLSVQDTYVIIEDLHSTNGVYVNEQRVVRGTVLRHGDRILIGATEMSLLESRSRGEDLRILEPQPESAVRVGAPRKLEIPSTARADALEMIGGVAERLAAAGSFEEAELALSGHLRAILVGANSGLSLPNELAASASKYALALARWSNQQFWMDYVVELHLSASLAMSAATLSAFEEVSAKLECDRVMLGYYVDDLQGRGEKLGPDERRRVERLRLLQRGSRA